MFFGVGIYMNENEKITLPKELQKQMVEFFLKTSIPRKKKEQEKIHILSEIKKSDRSNENEEKS